VREVIALFATELPGRLAAVKAAAYQRDAEQLRVAAHALKGMSASAVVEAAAALEAIGRTAALEHASAAWGRLDAAARSLMQVLAAGERNAQPEAAEQLPNVAML
jgi:HPt (histidine-containing phosphotransfer) domain-containing protein